MYAPAPTARKPHQPGPTPTWGQRLAPPRHGGRWPGAWEKGRAFGYGRRREVADKAVGGRWRVLGPDVPARAVVAKVAGDRKRFTRVTTATDLSGLQVVEMFCARFREEDGFRDLKQRLGWGECRAWTRNPIERTTQAVLLTMTALRLLPFEWQVRVGDEWWLHPPWHPRQARPGVRDVGRLLWEHRDGIQRCLADWLDNEGKVGG
ncbi:MAG: hypothetical protein JWO38_6330 [Gemmataceae bacterium]|nr:hypothetical protein [Gemmataceae bacterium]